MPTLARKESRAIPSDATLVWLASERAAPLFRSLDRPHAFEPLLVLLALVPPLISLISSDVTEASAAWELRTLDVLGVTYPRPVAGAIESVIPSERIRPAALWSSAALLELLRPLWPVGGSVSSSVGYLLLLASLWMLARSLAGRRFAFWAALMAIFHPTLIALVDYPAPVSLGLAFGAAGAWASFNVDQARWKCVATWLAGVVALVAGFAIIGPYAYAFCALVAADALLAWWLTKRVGDGRTSGRLTVSPARLAFRRTLLAAAGFGLCGLLDGFLPETPGLARPTSFTPSEDEPAPHVAEAAVVGPLWGLAAIGFGRILRVFHRRAATRSGRPVPRLVVLWLAAGLLMLARLGNLERFGGVFHPESRFAISFLGIAVVFAAAYAIEEAARRTVSGAWILLGIALPLAVRLGTLMAMIRADGPAVWLGLGLAAVAAMWLAAKIIPAVLPLTGLRRGFLMAAILAAVSIDAVDGVASVSRVTSDEDRRLADQLGRTSEADAVVLLADAPPLELCFALRATYPDAAFEVVPTWEEALNRLERRFDGDAFEAIVVNWGRGETAGAVAAEELKPRGSPMLFDGKELLLYDTRDAAAADAPVPARVADSDAGGIDLTHSESTATFPPLR